MIPAAIVQVKPATMRWHVGPGNNVRFCVISPPAALWVSENGRALAVNLSTQLGTLPAEYHM